MVLQVFFFRIVMFFCFAGFSAVLSAEVINGIVTDARRKPLAGAKVIAVKDAQYFRTAEELTPLDSAITDKEGKFSLDIKDIDNTVLIASAATGMITKFSIPKEIAKSRVLGLSLQAGKRMEGRVVDAENNPVEGVEIGPIIPSPDIPYTERMKAIPQWTVSDKDGKFSFHGLNPDFDYTFLGRKEGYEIINRVLSSDSTVIEVVLPKGGSFVQGEIFGKNMQPSVFANVLIRANGNGFDIMAKADGEGKFRIDGIPAGTFSIEPILLKDNRAAKVAVVEMPKDDGSSVSLEVSSGYMVEGTTIDAETDKPIGRVPVGLQDRWTTSSSAGEFRLGPFYEGFQIQPLVPEEEGWQIAGVAMDNEYSASDGFENLTGVKIRVRQKRSFHIDMENFETTTQTVVVTAIGENSKPVRYRAGGKKMELPVFHGGSYLVFASAGEKSSEMTSVSLTGQTSVPLTLSLGDSGKITGRLVLSNTDETTRVQKFKVALKAGADPTGKNGTLLAETEPTQAGYFRFAGLPRNEMSVVVTNETATRSMAVPVTVRSGDQTLPEIVWNSGNRLNGTVVNEAGQIIPAARITLRDATGGVQEISADVDGAFRVDDLPESSVPFLTVSANGYMDYRSTNVELPQDSFKIVLSKEGMLNVKLTDGGNAIWKLSLVKMRPWGSGVYADQLIGQVLMTRDMSGDEVGEIMVPDDGIFHVVAVKGGEPSVIAVSEAVEWKKKSPEGKTVELSSSDAGGISGTAAMAGVAVEITAINNTLPDGAGKQASEYSVTTTNGKFSLTGLKPGNYLVTGNGEGYSGVVMNVAVEGGKNTEVNLEAMEAVDLEGTVVLGGEGLPGVRMVLISETDQSAQVVEMTTGSDGRFRFENLLPDVYKVTALLEDKDGQMGTYKSVKITRGQPAPEVMLDLTPPKPVAVTGADKIGLTEESAVMIMNKESRQTFAGKWVGGVLEVSAPAGTYEVWNGDAPAGHLVISADGKGEISK